VRPRLVGVAEGTTVESSQGQVSIVLPCWTLLAETPPYPETTHTVAHEAFHVVTSQRGERLNYLAERHPGDAQARVLAPVAAKMIEEYRVERAAIESGHAPLEERRASLDGTLDDFRRHLRVAASPAAYRADEQRTLRTCLSVFAEIAEELGKVIAADLASAGEKAPTTHGASWERLIDGSYGELCDALGMVPSAAVATERAVLELYASDLIPVIAKWMRSAGLATGDDGDGGLMLGLVRSDF
jgi:hypothetical protein